MIRVLRRLLIINKIKFQRSIKINLILNNFRKDLNRRRMSFLRLLIRIMEVRLMIGFNRFRSRLRINWILILILKI